MKFKFTFLSIFAWVFAYAQPIPSGLSFTVTPDFETTPVDSPNDAADDVAIWIHPNHPEKSLILGTDKKSGINSYNLNGQLVQKLPLGLPNNIDIRQNVNVQGHRMDLIVASERETNEVIFLTIDSLNNQITRLKSAQSLRPNFEIYGVCLGYANNVLTVYVTNKLGAIAAWTINDLPSNMSFVKVAEFRFSSQIEGCVHDDYWQKIYIGEEDVGIWSLKTNGNALEEPKLIDSVNGQNGLTADVEGVSIYADSKIGDGYVLVSSQGSNKYSVYDRRTNSSIGQFSISATTEFDEVTHTDGIDATSVSLGTRFPAGIFIAQDDENDNGQNQNFKVVDFAKIKSELTARNRLAKKNK